MSNLGTNSAREAEGEDQPNVPVDGVAVYRVLYKTAMVASELREKYTKASDNENSWKKIALTLLVAITLLCMVHYVFFFMIMYEMKQMRAARTL